MLARIQNFLRLDAATGIVLVTAAVAALAMSNSPARGWYQALLDLPVIVLVGNLQIAKPLLLWVNDGLMAIFFLLVGLEIKRELIQGELSSVSKATLPIVAALGGMAAPAAIYAFVTWGDATALRGWAIPAATDIAFALGILLLLGSRVPASLRIFLTAVAIIDDLGAIVIIALFYTDSLSLPMIGLASLGVAALVLLNRCGVERLGPYLAIGVVVWVCVLKSGVHATLAGVFTALAIPLAVKGSEESPLIRLEHNLHDWVSFGVLPLFAFMNAGVALGSLSLGAFTEPIPLGIVAGLLAGKPLGILALSWLAMTLGFASLPSEVNWRQFAGVAALCGIGFTMSLFIGTLAFEGLDASYLERVKLGVLTGSVLSGLLGAAIFLMAPKAATNIGIVFRTKKETS